MLILGFTAPKTVQAFTWPRGTDLTAKLQVIRQELSNIATLIAAQRSQKPMTAAGYIAVDLSNGSILAQKNSVQTYPVASTAKLMSALIATEDIDPDKTITLTDEMLLPYGNSPAVYPGLEISASDLMRAALTQSVNDAAESLAYFTGKEKFPGLMNKKAKELAMTGTTFIDPHGLDPKNRSNAADMAKLLGYIYKKQPEILETTKDDNFWLPDAEGKMLKFINLNEFYGFPEFIGGKSGYLVEAGQTFAGVFTINKKPTAIVLLHATDYRADTFRIIEQISK